VLRIILDDSIPVSLIDTKAGGVGCTRHCLGAPKTSGDCRKGPRPCPWGLCRYHLATDVAEDGQIIRRVGDLEDMQETCALDVVAYGGLTQERVGELQGVTTGRIC